MDVDQPQATVTFEELYRREFDYVARSLRRLGAHPSDVKDLCHEVFLDVHRKLPVWDRTRPVRPWLFGFAFRAVADLKGRAHQRREVSGMELSSVPGPADPHSQAEASQARRLVLEVLESLPEERRAAFIMHELDGASAPEIADALGAPLNTIYSRLRVARAEVTTALRARVAEGAVR